MIKTLVSTLARKTDQKKKRILLVWLTGRVPAELSERFFRIVRALPTKTWIFIELCLNCFFAVNEECEKNLKENSSYCFCEGFFGILRGFWRFLVFFCSSFWIFGFGIYIFLGYIKWVGHIIWDLGCKLIEFGVCDAEIRINFYRMEFKKFMKGKVFSSFVCINSKVSLKYPSKRILYQNLFKDELKNWRVYIKPTTKKSFQSLSKLKLK